MAKLGSTQISARRVAVFGSTGSIGTNALDVIAALPDQLRVVGLTAHTRWQTLAQQCQRFRPRVAILTDRDSFQQADRSAFPKETELRFGEEECCKLAQAEDVETVLAAIVGAAGLPSTWAAIQAGKTIALANKETMAVAGPLVAEEVARRGATILPVDSEHSAIFQALTHHQPCDVHTVVLTASGGPFRGKRRHDLHDVTPQQALNHPTWNMGPKNSIDSATMMNKALELIEARWLFHLSAAQLDVIVHPSSVVHSFVEFVDGSVLAQLSPPDMRLPIQLALTHPCRISGPATRTDWANFRTLEFEPADRDSFPALNLGFEVAQRGGSCGAVLNAANEIAVERFLDGSLRFLDITECCRAVLDNHDYDPTPTLDGLLAADRWARHEVRRWMPS